MELFGINSAEFLVILILALVVVGPKGFVQVWRGFKKLLAYLRAFSAKLRAETDLQALAADLKIDPAKLDLRQYDPRAMVRAAVREEMEAWAQQARLGPPTGAAAKEIGGVP
jgi:sec-independent protein translocase protein TatB